MILYYLAFNYRFWLYLAVSTTCSLPC